MNKITITGNLTRDPEPRTTANGVNVTEITVAVNERHGQNQSTTFFRVSCWRGLGETVQKYLKKGAKVLVTGPVSCRAWIGKDNQAHAQMEITADQLEFLSSRAEAQAAAMQAATSSGADAPPSPEGEGPAAQDGANLDGFIPVDDSDLPF